MNKIVMSIVSKVSLFLLLLTSVCGAGTITWDGSSFWVEGYSAGTPCTLEDLYQFDLTNGPSPDCITRTDDGTNYTYWVTNANISVGINGVDSYFQIGHDATTKNKDEVLFITGNLNAEDPGSGADSYITVGDSSDTNINPTILFNPSSNNEFAFNRKKTHGYISLYNCTVKSATTYHWHLGGIDEYAAKSRLLVLNATILNHENGYNSYYHSYVNATNSTFSSSGHGLYLGHSGNLTAKNCTFTTTGANRGISGAVHNTATLVDCEINGGASGYNGIYLSQADWIRCANCQISAPKLNARAFQIDVTPSSTNYLRDSVLNSHASSTLACCQFEGHTATTRGLLEVVNTAYNPFIPEVTTKSNRLDRSWYLDVYVEDTYGAPVEGATVSIATTNGEVNIGYATNPMQWVLGDYAPQVTGADGHTPLPSTGNSFILRDYRKDDGGTHSNNTYDISVDNGGVIVETNGIDPSPTWYRTNIDIPAYTVTVIVPRPPRGSVVTIK